MTKVMTDESNYSAIASQIRSKLGVSTRYKPSEMAAAIGSISGVSSADNGKVVVDGQLTQQTSRSVSQNGTYDTTTNNEVVVSVSGGGGGGSTNILSGTSAPSASDGDDGDVYMRYSRGGVRNTIGQYINTGYSGGNSSKYVMEFSFDGNQNDQYPTPFGGRSAASSVTNASSIHFQASNTLYGWGSAQQTVNVGYGTADGSLTRIELSAGSFKIEKQDGSNTYTFTPSSISSTTPIGIFALLANGSVVNGCRAGNMTLYSFEIYEGDTLVHKFVPAIDENDVVCVYDEVADEYKYHTGSGSLEYIEEGKIVGTYLKVNGSWLPLIGQDIDDVNLGG